MLFFVNGGTRKVLFYGQFKGTSDFIFDALRIFYRTTGHEIFTYLKQHVAQVLNHAISLACGLRGLQDVAQILFDLRVEKGQALVQTVLFSSYTFLEI